MSSTGKNIYFASDIHLGMHPRDKSIEREKHVVSWLTSIKDDVAELWLLGDVFDYWFEYKKVVPRGFTRFLGKLAELSDNGAKIHFFSGNHDVWLFNYFTEELGAEIHHEALVREFGDQTFFMSHGDGLTKYDRGYLFLKSMFRSKFLQWCYARIHPNASTAFAQWWSRKSRYSKALISPFKGYNKEEQLIFARNFLEEAPDIDVFIFGHRHVPFDVEVGDKSRVIGLGDWIHNFTYAVFDGNEIQLKKYEKPIDPLAQ